MKWRRTGGGVLLLLLLSVCDDVADVLVVNVASHIRGESGPQVLHLEKGEHRKRQWRVFHKIKRPTEAGRGAIARKNTGHWMATGMEALEASFKYYC